MSTKNMLEVQQVYKKYISQNTVKGGEKCIKALDGISVYLGFLFLAYYS